MRLQLAILALSMASCGKRLEVSALQQQSQNRQVVTALLTAPACTAGLQAYKETLYRSLRESQCVRCHGGGHEQAPPYANRMAEESYERVKTLVNFGSPGESRLIGRALNGHCDEPGNPACSDHETADALAGSIRAWWDQGESSCDASYRRTADAAVPSDLSTSDYTKIEWDLGSFGADLSGYRLQAEIKGLAGGPDGPVAAYEVRMPRIISRDGQSGFRVRGLRILVNGNYQAYANGFENIDAEVGPVAAVGADRIYPAMSPALVTLVAGNQSSDHLTAAVQILEPITVANCRSLETFTAKIRPMLDNNSCATCHGADPLQGPPPYMSQDPQELCGQMRQYVGPSTSFPPVLFEKPLSFHRLSHPELLDTTLQRSEAIRLLSEWSAAERSADR